MKVSCLKRLCVANMVCFTYLHLYLWTNEAMRLFHRLSLYGPIQAISVNWYMKRGGKQPWFGSILLNRWLPPKSTTLRKQIRLYIYRFLIYIYMYIENPDSIKFSLYQYVSDDVESLVLCDFSSKHGTRGRKYAFFLLFVKNNHQQE